MLWNIKRVWFSLVIRPLFSLGLMEDGDALEQAEEEKTAEGSNKVKYQETFRGIHVFGKTVVLEKQDGRFTSFVEGNLVEGIRHDVKSTTPKLAKSRALEIALRHAHDELRDVEYIEDDCKLQIYEKDGKGFLTWFLSYNIETSKKISRPYYLIDALDGSVIDHWEGLTSSARIMKSYGGNFKIGRKELRLEVDARGGKCHLENKLVKVVHMNFGSRDQTSAYAVSCNSPINDQVNQGYSAASDALHYGKVVYNLYEKWYSDTTIKRSIGQLVMRVHYNRGFENAFWDGRKMTFGDGKYRFYPLVSLDVVAHEVSHGFTQRTSHLVYRGQSGGMNEAFSDMCGEAAENFDRGKNDFKIGYDIFKAKGAMRHMDNPALDGKSIAHASRYREGMDVHHSSGVYNKAFYTLAQKWGVKKAFGVFVKANKMYWNANSNFQTGACGVNSAARDLGYNVNDVKLAFQGVGVTCSGGTTPPPPKPYTSRPRYTVKPKYTRRPPYTSRPRYTVRPKYTRRPPYTSRPRYTPRPPYTRTPPYTSRPRFTPRPPYTRRPPYTSRPRYTLRPKYTRRPPYTSRPRYTLRPKYTRRPPYTSRPRYTLRPRHTWRPPYTSRPRYTWRPPYTSRPWYTRRPKYMR